MGLLEHQLQLLLEHAVTANSFHFAPVCSQSHALIPHTQPGGACCACTRTLCCTVRLQQPLPLLHCLPLLLQSQVASCLPPGDESEYMTANISSVVGQQQAAAQAQATTPELVPLLPPSLCGSSGPEGKQAPASGGSSLPLFPVFRPKGQRKVTFILQACFSSSAG